MLVFIMLSKIFSRVNLREFEFVVGDNIGISFIGLLEVFLFIIFVL